MRERSERSESGLQFQGGHTGQDLHSHCAHTQVNVEEDDLLRDARFISKVLALEFPAFADLPESSFKTALSRLEAEQIIARVNQSQFSSSLPSFSDSSDGSVSEQGALFEGNSCIWTIAGGSSNSLHQQQGQRALSFYAQLVMPWLGAYCAGFHAIHAFLVANENATASTSIQVVTSKLLQLANTPYACANTQHLSSSMHSNTNPRSSNSVHMTDAQLHLHAHDQLKVSYVNDVTNDLKMKDCLHSESIRGIVATLENLGMVCVQGTVITSVKSANSAITTSKTTLPLQTTAQAETASPIETDRSSLSNFQARPLSGSSGESDHTVQNDTVHASWDVMLARIRDLADTRSSPVCSCACSYICIECKPAQS